MTQTHARKTDPVSSHEAAQSNATIRHIQVHEIASQFNPGERLTAYEIAELGNFKAMDKVGVSRRMTDLEKRDLVVRAGFRKCRIAKRKCQVWLRTEKLPNE